jgi:hypothetical protein
MPIDYQHTNYDLSIANGDFVKAESTVQHKNLLFVTAAGEWRQYPMLGIGAVNFLQDDEMGGIYTKIQEQYKLDGLKVSGLKVTADGKVTDNSYYP